MTPHIIRSSLSAVFHMHCPGQCYRLSSIALLCCVLSRLFACVLGACVLYFGLERLGGVFSVRGLLVVCICSCLLLFCLWQSTSTTASATTMETFLLSILSVLLSPLFPFQWLCVCVCVVLLCFCCCGNFLFRFRCTGCFLLSSSIAFCMLNKGHFKWFFLVQT